MGDDDDEAACDWVDLSAPNQPYEVQLDRNAAAGATWRWRHRRRPAGGGEVPPWLPGHPSEGQPGGREGKGRR
ncbi:hypothetical protein [Pseudoroseicyclus tamaricis]|uniref:Uncharacterized protein n=1 Tax=Pseudoroseicyclus tamaricis TaxID=2705421 RepID=A0A6B2JT34_9RHOB|nr:hypothetical protein [Pseudoroseicyclus tamaricis]NDV01180.1 hypothetical protein [Pseudoroseicyclus tamaricis]